MAQSTDLSVWLIRTDQAQMSQHSCDIDAQFIVDPAPQNEQKGNHTSGYVGKKRIDIHVYA